MRMRLKAAGVAVGERAFDEDEGGSPDGDHEGHQQVGAEFHVFGLCQAELSGVRRKQMQVFPSPAAWIELSWGSATFRMTPAVGARGRESTRFASDFIGPGWRGRPGRRRRSWRTLVAEDGRGGDFVEIAIDEDEVGVVAGDEFAFALLCEFGVGGALRVGVERLAAGEFVFGIVSFGSGFVHAGDGGIESAKWRDGLDGIVGAKGERDAGIEEGFPRVGVCGALGRRADPRPSSCR